jgi:hypothetical protein
MVSLGWWYKKVGDDEAGTTTPMQTVAVARKKEIELEPQYM